MTITAHSFYQLSQSAFYGGFVQLSSTVGVLLHGESGGNYYVRKVAMSGSTVSSASAATDTGLTYYGFSGEVSSKITKLSGTTALIKVQTSSAAAYLQVVDVSGVTPTVGVAQNLGTNASANDFEIYGLSATQALHVYQDNVPTYKTYAAVVSISGTSLTDNTQYQIAATASAGLSICDLGSSNFAIIYRAGSSAYDITGVYLSISGTVITPQSGVDVTPETTGSITGRVVADVLSSDGSRILVGYVWKDAAGVISYLYVGIIGVSGTVLSTVTDKLLIRSSSSVGLETHKRTAQYDNNRVVFLFGTTTGGTETAYLAEIRYTGGSLVNEDEASIGSDTTVAYWAVNRSPEAYIPIYRSDTSSPYVELALYELDSLAVSNKTLSLSTPTLGGDYLWSTMWDGTNIQLRKFDIGTLQHVSDTDLGAVSDSELEVDYVAYVTQIDDDRLIVFGRMNSPAGLSGVHHIIASDDGGSSWYSIEAGWSTDFCTALDIDVIEGVVAIRNKASDESQVYVGNMTIVNLSATIPMSVSLGGLNRTVDGTILLASDQNQAIKVLRSVAPYTTFEDITSNLAATGCKKVIGL